MANFFLNYAGTLNPSLKMIIAMVLDLLAFVITFHFSILLRVESLDYSLLFVVWSNSFFFGSITILILFFFGCYDSYIRYFGRVSAFRYSAVSFGCFGILFAVGLVLNLPIPRSTPIIQFPLYVGLALCTRFAFSHFSNRQNFVDNARQYFVAGVGHRSIEIGKVLESLTGYGCKGYIAINSRGKIRDVPVLNVVRFEALIKGDVSAPTVVLPAGYDDGYLIDELERLEASGLIALVRGGSAERILGGFLSLGSRRRNIDIDHLLGRAMLVGNDNLVVDDVKNKNVLVTGGCGSIGSEICRSLLLAGAKKVCALDQSEVSLYEVCNELEYSTKFVGLLGSVSDEPMLERVLREQDIEVIFHAAAYKHVPIAESNPCELVKNNVGGFYSTLRVFENSLASKLVLISTDKAVRPTNVMGASKRVCELLAYSFAQRLVGKKISIVRFGNVIGSSGSVIPLFLKQIESGGPVTVTHAEVTRYFMSISEAAFLSIQAAFIEQTDGVLVFDMGKPIKILDLAKHLIQLHRRLTGENVPIELIGMRPGEKLFEELSLSDRVLETTHPKICRAVEKIEDLDGVVPYVVELMEFAEHGKNAKVKGMLRDYGDVHFSVIKADSERV